MHTQGKNCHVTVIRVEIGMHDCLGNNREQLKWGRYKIWTLDWTMHWTMTMRASYSCTASCNHLATICPELETEIHPAKLNSHVIYLYSTAVDSAYKG